MGTESGDDFVNARTDHLVMLEHYLDHMEQRRLSHVLRVLAPKLSPRIQLKPLLQNLRKPVADQEEARDQIRGAAEVLDQFVSNSEKSSVMAVGPVGPEVLPDELLEALENALKESHKAVDEFEKRLDFSAAEQACRANRVCIALVYLARSGYEVIGDERVVQFRNDIKRTIHYNDIVQRSALDRQRALLRRYSHSEYRRLEVLKAILDKDMQRARELLRTAIKTAYTLERQIR
jgi:hypothetical protein